ncbi:MAG: EamA family transporter [Candidatus Nanohalobium sp.]
MVDFIFYGLLAGVFFGSGNLADKYLMANRDETGMVPTVLSGFLGFVPALTIFGFTRVPLNLYSAGFAVLGGLFIFGGRYAYFKAMKVGEASDVSVLGRINPLFVFILSIIFLGQSFTGAELIGFSLMFLGGLIVSAKDFDPEKMKFNKATVLVIVSVMMYAVTDVLMKVSTENISYLPAYASALIGALIASVMISFNSSVRSSLHSWRDRRFMKLLLPGRVFFYLGFLFFTLALETGKVALVTASAGIQPVFVIMAVLGLRKIGWDYFPQEDMSLKVNIIRIASILLFAAGVYILTI